jgi:deoxyribonuclease-4
MIRLGPAGSGGLGNLDGVKEVRRVGLDAMEVEFTYGVRMSNSEAKKVGELAKKLGVTLSVHAPYYVNLASEEKGKIVASKKRVLDSCERAHHLGASHVVFHPGFYGKRAKEDVYRIIKEAIEDMMGVIKKNKWKKVVLAPETTGKRSQFGDLDELLRLRKEAGCELCVDFAHLLARNGSIDYDEVFDKIRGLRHIHSHFSGIEYTEKGERRHIITEREVIVPLVKRLLKREIDITIINESPDPFGDSLKTKKIVQSLQ